MINSQNRKILHPSVLNFRVQNTRPATCTARLFVYVAWLTNHAAVKFANLDIFIK